MNQAFIFSAGLVVGGIAGYYICKKRYHIVKAEVVEIKETKKEEPIKNDISKEEPSYMKHEEKTGDEEWDEAEKQYPVEPEMIPYVISPEAFANEKPEYAKVTLVYYEENEVLINEEEETVDIDSNIGYDSINHFGEFEKDAVFIRNESLGNDYEVLLEHASWEGGE